MVEYTDIFVSGSIQSVQQMVNQVFQQNKFNVQWQDQYVGKAHRGSKGKNIAFGAFAQYYEIDFQIFTAPDRSIAVRLIKSTTGWMGGAIGAHNVKKQYQQVVDMLTNYFNSQGMYKGRNPP